MKELSLLPKREPSLREKSCPYGYCIYELAIWRNTLRRLFTRHCHIDDLTIWEPELARELIEKRYVFKNGVKYKLTKKGSHVHMIPARLCADPRPESDRITEPDTEKCKSRILGRMENQRVLFSKDFSSQEKSSVGGR